MRAHSRDVLLRVARTSPSPMRGSRFARTLLSGLVLATVAACGGDGEERPAGSGSAGAGSAGGGGAALDALGLPRVAAATTPLAQSPALSAYQEGAQLARSGRYEEASTKLREALELDPSRPEIALALGQALVESAEISLGYETRDRDTMSVGIAALQRAHDQRPEDPDVAFWLGQAQYFVHAREPAIEALGRALANDPAHSRARMRLAAIHVENGEAAEAREALAPIRTDATLGPDTDTGRAQFEVVWGMLLELEDDRAGAAEAYERATALAPSNENARFLLGTVLAKLGRRDEAQTQLDAYEQTLARKAEVNSLERRAEYVGNDPNLWLQVGIARAQLGQLKRAATRLRRVLALSPGDRRAHFWLGVVAKEDGRLDDARRNLEVVVRADGAAAEPRMVLGQVLLELGEPAAAQGMLQQAASLAPRVPDVQASLARAAAANEAAEVARAALTALRALAPDDPRLGELEAEVARVEGNR